MKLKKGLTYSIIILFSLFAFLFALFAGLDNIIVNMALSKGRGESDPNVVLVTIDDFSLNRIGQYPWDRRVHAALIDRLAEDGAAVIALDLLFTEPSQDPEADAVLAEAIRSAGNVILPLEANFGTGIQAFIDVGDTGAVMVNGFFGAIPEFAEAAAGHGYINAINDEVDGYARQALPYIKDSLNNQMMEAFSLVAYKLYRENTGKPAYKGLNPAWDKRPYINFSGVPGFIDSYSVAEVLDTGAIEAGFFKDKLILVGPTSPGLAQDFFNTAVDPTTQMYGVEIHANIINNYIYDDFKFPVRFMPQFWTMLAILIALAFVFLRSEDGRVIGFVGVGTLAAYTAVGVIMFINGLVLDLVTPLVAIALITLAAAVFRTYEISADRHRISKIFGRYVSPEIMDELISEGSQNLELGGVNRLVSILFIDIRGFTSLSESLSPEGIVEILNDYLELVTGTVFRFGGTIDKFIGDAAMALYNAPSDMENHELRAIETALAICERQDELNKSLQEKLGKTIGFGVGICTGNVVVGNIGCAARMDYTAIGDSVNTASRLCGQAGAGQILVSESTYSACSDAVEAEFIGDVSVKGKTKVVATYSIQGLK